MKEIIVSTDCIESIKLLDEGNGLFKLKTEKLDYKKELRNKGEPINFDVKKLKSLRNVLNLMYPAKKTEIPIDSIKRISNNNEIISLGELARYLEFDVQDMINLLPNNINVTVIGNDLSKALIKISELNKSSVTVDLKSIKIMLGEKNENSL